MESLSWLKVMCEDCCVMIKSIFELEISWYFHFCNNCVALVRRVHPYRPKEVSKRPSRRRRRAPRRRPRRGRRRLRPMPRRSANLKNSKRRWPLGSAPRRKRSVVCRCAVKLVVCRCVCPNVESRCHHEALKLFLTTTSSRDLNEMTKKIEGEEALTHLHTTQGSHKKKVKQDNNCCVCSKLLTHMHTTLLFFFRTLPIAYLRCKFSEFVLLLASFYCEPS